MLTTRFAGIVRLSLGVVVTCSAGLVAQLPYPPVPPEMESAFVATTHAVRLSPEAQGQDWAFAFLRFSTTEKNVSLDWAWSVSGSSTKGKYDTQSVSYRPTAIGLHAGQGTDFYVAGYDVRNGQAVVERWSVINMAFSETVSPTGEPIVGFSYNLVRTPLLRTDALTYIRGIVYNLHAEELLLFAEGFPHRVWRYSPELDTLNVLVDSTTLPELDEYLSFATIDFLSGSSEPGFAVIGRPWRAWMSPHVLPDDLLILRDEDRDGVFDEMGEIPWTEYDARGYYDFKNAYYDE